MALIWCVAGLSHTAVVLCIRPHEYRGTEHDDMSGQELWVEAIKLTLVACLLGPLAWLQ